MKYIFQFLLILLISFLAEILHALIPLPVPASVYGLVLMFAALALKIVKLEHVEGASGFLLKIMPVLFIPAAAGVVAAAGLIAANLWIILIVVTVTTAIVAAITGVLAQTMVSAKEKKEKKEAEDAELSQ